MFAIIETGGKQYKVEKGLTLDIEKLETEAEKSVNFDKVIMIGEASDIKIGTPFIEGAYVTAKILSHKKDKKVIIFKMKAKKRYKVTKGHRQELTTIEITNIAASGGKKPEKIEKPATKPKEKPATAEKPVAKKATVKKPAVKKTPKKTSPKAPQAL
ncbi:MAG: 50S ribosomal protein L21 [Candidatus Peregrinibacteria bacterium]